MQTTKDGGPSHDGSTTSVAEGASDERSEASEDQMAQMQRLLDRARAETTADEPEKTT